MSQPKKHILVYADGRVVESKQKLEGQYYIVPEMVSGDLWERKFEVHLAHDGLPGTFSKTCSMVAVECEFRFVKSAADMAHERAEWDVKTMKAALWGIANYPGDEKP